ncbi:MAG: restriction endonuclease subunit S [Bacteroidetes bacterium]|uniref:restriction endonuclease subunit S n=1 Tax=Flavobacterium sp. TaxID=239 RepID=UPI002FDA0731|nr:restriction endonuclease subunit S [Bacteroidota bacterium]
MITYENYKKSGIEWLGDIPSNWKTIRTTDVSISNKSLNRNLLENNLLSLSYGKIIRKDINTAVGLLPASFENYQIVEKGDIILRLTDLQNDKKSLRVGLVEEKGIITSAYLGLKLNSNVNSKFIFYLLYSYDINKVFYSQGGSMRQSMKFDDFKSIYLVIPDEHSQKQIATYLDNKTEAIDKKIDLLSKKINYYKEYCKSIINETVCKGLDKNVKLKETELGFKVNSNYNNYRLKDLGKLYSGLSGKAGDDFNQDININNKGFIPFTNIANNIYLKKDHLGTVVVYENEKQNKVKKGDIFFLMSSEGYEDIGKSAILDDELEETYLNSFCKGFRMINKKANPYFLNYILLSDNYRKQLTVEGKGFTRINLKMEKVNDFVVYIPKSIQEQNNIVEYIDTKTQTIDKIIKNINSQITILKQLRKTLINDVVTGKIKVTQD